MLLSEVQRYLLSLDPSYVQRQQLGGDQRRPRTDGARYNRHIHVTPDRPSTSGLRQHEYGGCLIILCFAMSGSGGPLANNELYNNGP